MARSQQLFSFFESGENPGKEKPEDHITDEMVAELAEITGAGEFAPDDFAGARLPGKTDRKKCNETDGLSNIEARQALLCWLLARSPSGLATDVPTRISKYQVDLAAFWSVQEKKLLKPAKTLIVEIRNTRESCWPDCSNKSELIERLKEAKLKRFELEAEIRKREPQLKDNNSLFEEFENWNYQDSDNQDYQRCLRLIEKTEHALYKGSRFEHIRQARMADYLFLAVPEGAVAPEELADGWGLLYFDKDLNVTMVKEAYYRQCPEEHRLHLIQNIASSSLKNTLFANGVNYTGNIARITPLPRRRRKAQREIKISKDD